jgi:type IV pilus assembly protein PilA
MLPAGEPSQAPGPGRGTSGLATFALVLAALPCGITSLAGALLGLVALARIKRRPEEVGGRSVAISAVVVGLAGSLVVAGLFALVNFGNFHELPKNRECKGNLKEAYRAEQAWFSAHHSYELHPGLVGFIPERGNRYLYLFDGAARPGGNDTSIGVDVLHFPSASNEALAAALPADLRERLGVSGTCPDCSLTLACVGNVDEDPSPDIWSISSAARPGAPAGVLKHDFDDLTELAQ